MLREAAIETRLREAVALQRVVTRAGRHSPAQHRGESRDSLVQERTAGTVAEPISWLDWLEREDAALVEARLEGARWKMICWRFGISRPTAYRRWRYALGLIAWRLSGNAVPAACSRRRFLQMSASRM